MIRGARLLPVLLGFLVVCPFFLVLLLSLVFFTGFLLVHVLLVPRTPEKRVSRLLARLCALSGPQRSVNKKERQTLCSLEPVQSSHRFRPHLRCQVPRRRW